MRDLEHLADKHFELCHSESPRHRAELLIWYADVGVEIDSGTVRYHCPECGRKYQTNIDEFVHYETRTGLVCDICRGEPEERVGALD